MAEVTGRLQGCSLENEGLLKQVQAPGLREGLQHPEVHGGLPGVGQQFCRLHTFQGPSFVLVVEPQTPQLLLTGFSCPRVPPNKLSSVQRPDGLRVFLPLRSGSPQRRDCWPGLRFWNLSLGNSCPALKSLGTAGDHVPHTPGSFLDLHIELYLP